MRAVFERLPADGYFVQIPGFYHVNPTDIPYWWPLLTSLLKIRGPIDWRRAHAITNDFTLAFFNRYLKGLPDSSPEVIGRIYPEVRLERRVNE
jgi:hypothetical protein